MQAEHYPESGSAALLRIARQENEKVAKLKPLRYLLITSASLSPLLKAKLKEAMPAAPLATADILGRADLNNLLGRHQQGPSRAHGKFVAGCQSAARVLIARVSGQRQPALPVILQT